MEFVWNLCGICVGFVWDLCGICGGFVVDLWWICGVGSAVNVKVEGGSVIQLVSRSVERSVSELVVQYLCVVMFDVGKDRDREDVI